MCINALTTMSKSNSFLSDDSKSSPFSRWKVIWPTALLVIGGFSLVILSALGIKVDTFMIH